ncbi:MAG TPA: CCA tRNA nucleotidyltransferase [Longimicrobiales bacterium]|nr:CCA tRNA nucleotidyltransferase [Longimicrobiales bacterium]
MQLSPPRSVLEIAQKLDHAGHDVWAVGGAVRDALLGTPHVDWDLATSARPHEVRRLFRRTVPIGIEHGTVGVFGADGVLYEVTTFRRDIETSGRHAVVEFAHTIDEDLSRRDFTFNAMAWHPIHDEVRDPYHGLADLKAARLRTVGEPAERFAEDYLRVLRGLRFAGHFVLEPEPSTWAALTAAVPHLTVLSAERVREELLKVLGRTPHASAALLLYERSGALAQLYPELQQLASLTLGDAPSDAWRRTLAAVDAIPQTRPLLRLTALLHAVGMPAAASRDLRGGWRFTGHEVFGARKARELMERLKASNADTERVATLVAKQSDLFPPDSPDAGVRRWLLHVPPALVPDLFRLRIALWRANPVARGDDDLAGRWRHVRRVLAAQPPLATGDLAIDGDDLKTLGLPPGPRYGEILRELLDCVIEDPSLNDRKALLRMVREMDGDA